MPENKLSLSAVTAPQKVLEAWQELTTKGVEGVAQTSVLPLGQKKRRFNRVSSVFMTFHDF